MPLLDATIRPSPIDPRFALTVAVDESGKTEAMSEIPGLQEKAYQYGVAGATAQAAGELISEAHKGFQLGKLGGQIERITAPTRESLTQIASLENDIHGLKQQKRLATSHEEVSKIEPQLAAKMQSLIQAKQQGFLNSNDVTLRVKAAVREAINNNPGYTTALSNYASDVLWASGIREIGDPTPALDAAEAQAKKQVRDLQLKQAQSAGVFIDATKMHDETYMRERQVDVLNAMEAKNAIDDIIAGKKIADINKAATTSERNKRALQMQNGGRATINDVVNVTSEALNKATTPQEKAQIKQNSISTVEDGLDKLRQHYVDSGHSISEAENYTDSLRTYYNNLMKLHDDRKNNKISQEQFVSAVHFDKAIEEAYETLGFSKEFRKIAAKTNTAEKAALLKENPALANQIKNFTKLQAHIIDPDTRAMLVENMRAFDNKPAAVHWLTTYMQSGNYEMVQEVTDAYTRMLKNLSSPMLSREDRIKGRDVMVSTLSNLAPDAHKFLSSETKANVTEALHDQITSVMHFVNGSKKTYNYSNKMDENGIILTVLDERGNVDNEKTATARNVFGVRINEALKVYSRINGKSMNEAANALLPQYTDTLGVTLPEQTKQGGQDMLSKEFIKSKEGFREKAYKDGAGKWTIGYGFTSIDGTPVKEGDVISKEDAEFQLDRILDEHKTFKNKITRELTPYQEDALASFEYNLGGGVWNKPRGMKIIEAINNGDFNTAAELWRTYNKIKNPKTGQYEVSKGLVSRREEEAKMLMA